MSNSGSTQLDLVRNESTSVAPPVALPDSVRALLAAVHVALDMPEPAFTDLDEWRFVTDVARQTSDIRDILRNVIDQPHTASATRAAADLTGWLAMRSMGYAPLSYDDDSTTSEPN